MPEAFIIDAVRTPRGIGKKTKGSLAHLHPHRAAATVLRAIAERNDLNTAEVDDVIWATSCQQGLQGQDLGRMAVLEAGFDQLASSVTLDRFCGSGITSVNFGAAQIMSGMEDLVISGGSEMMSYTSTLVDPKRPLVLDNDNLTLRALHPQTHQGVAGDAIASLEGIDREATDELAFNSQQRAARAIAEGRFEKSLVPVLNDDGTVALARDEFPRPDTTLETLSQLRPTFEAVAELTIDDEGTSYRDLVLRKYPQLKGNFRHVHHAGNSSGVVDGAATVLLASEAYAKRNGLKPRGRVVAMANAGDCPTLMLNAPIPAIRKVLDKAGLSISDIDLFEINEAFAVVPEKAIRDLKLDREKVNVNGGAIALGHPIGATGSILIGTALDELERRGKRYALITMCAGGGMAPAIVIERV
jgi:acetyl-CoA C-acetyltransferase